MIRPSASCPTAVRGWRGPSWYVGEGLVGAEDGAAVSNDHRAAADRIGDSHPVGPQDHPQCDEGSDRSFRREPLSRRSAGDEHGAVAGDGRAADARELNDRSDQVGVGRRRRERLDDHLCHAHLSRRREAVAGGEQRDGVLSRRLVEVGERPPLAETAPRPEQLDPPNIDCPLLRDTDTRPIGGRRAVDDAVAHHARRSGGRYPAHRSRR